MLHDLTFAQLIRYAEYSYEFQREQSRLNAIELGLTLGILKYKDSSLSHSQSDNQTITGNGLSELIRRNSKGNGR